MNRQPVIIPDSFDRRIAQTAGWVIIIASFIGLFFSIIKAKTTDTDTRGFSLLCTIFALAGIIVALIFDHSFKNMRDARSAKRKSAIQQYLLLPKSVKTPEFWVRFFKEHSKPVEAVRLKNTEKDRDIFFMWKPGITVTEGEIEVIVGDAQRHLCMLRHEIEFIKNNNTYIIMFSNDPKKETKVTIGDKERFFTL